MSARSLIPVTVLTGFLGSGKTTLLNRILTEQHGKKIAIIENEFGEVGVDNQLVIQSEEELFEMNNGCICCTVRGDLIRILTRLAKRKDKLDAVLIETTGLANPGPVAQTFFTDPEVQEHYELDGIITVVDAHHILQHLDASPEPKAQIAFADVILLNKIDLVTPEELQGLETRIRKINASARIHATQGAALPLTEVLGLGGFDLKRATEISPQFLEPEFPFEWAGVIDLGLQACSLQFDSGPDAEISIVLVPLKNLDDTELGRARDTASKAFSEPAPLLQTGQALVPSKHPKRLALDAATQSFSLSPSLPGLYALFTQHHPDEFAAKRLPCGSPLTQAVLWQRTFKPNHEHDDEVSSVGLLLEGELDSKRLNAWLADLLRSKGADLFRSKGVLCLQGSEKRLVFQGVHMLFSAAPDREWLPGESRLNTLIFIGRNLDRAALNAGFRACLAST